VPFLRPASFVALLSAGIIGAGDRAWAQTPEQFYAGKNIDFVIGYPPGGSNDTLGRLVARHIGKHIPGKPNIIAKNMPGAGSFLAVNTVFNVSPKDGSVIGIGAPTMPLDERLGTQGVRFKTAELNWIGRTDSLINMVFMWKTSPVKTIADALKMESTLSGTGVGSTVSIYPTALNNVIGTRFKLVMGYKGSNEAMLAVERGEVEGHSTSWTALKVAHPDWVRDKTVSILVQFSLTRHPELPDVPTAVDLARNDERDHERGRGRHRLLHHARRAGGSRDRAAARVRRHHEGSRAALRGRTHQGRHLAADGRGAAETGGGGQQPLPCFAGQGPRRLQRGQDELTGSCAHRRHDSDSDAGGLRSSRSRHSAGRRRRERGIHSHGLEV
jgi:tripartite-type tricarboxylate transporter receptor subunit TctC